MCALSLFSRLFVSLCLDQSSCKDGRRVVTWLNVYHTHTRRHRESGHREGERAAIECNLYRKATITITLRSSPATVCVLNTSRNISCAEQQVGVGRMERRRRFESVASKSSIRADIGGDKAWSVARN